MRVDSFAYLPRSFRSMYAEPPRLPGEDAPVWSPFEKRLADSRIALVTSAGVYVEGEQEPFDMERERREPAWGDPSWRAIPATTPQGGLGMTHLHVNSVDTLADHEVSLPMRTLASLVDDGIVGSSALTHYSVMGYQSAGLDEWRARTGPEIVARLRQEDVDAAVLAPT